MGLQINRLGVSQSDETCNVQTAKAETGMHLQQRLHQTIDGRNRTECLHPIHL